MASATVLLSSISSLQHVARRHEFFLIVLDASGASRNLADGASVVPPILRTRSAISSVAPKICGGLFVQQHVIVAKVRAADMPMKVLGLQIERKESARRPFSASEIPRTASSLRSVGVSSAAGGLARIRIFSPCCCSRASPRNWMEDWAYTATDNGRDRPTTNPQNSQAFLKSRGEPRIRIRHIMEYIGMG